ITAQLAHVENLLIELRPAAGATACVDMRTSHRCNGAHSVAFRDAHECTTAVIASCPPSILNAVSTRGPYYLMKIEARPQHQSFSIASEAGFTLMELLIVMSIMLIIMAFAVPQMLRLKKQANEASAKQS